MVDSASIWPSVAPFFDSELEHSLIFDFVYSETNSVSVMNSVLRFCNCHIIVYNLHMRGVRGELDQIGVFI